MRLTSDFWVAAFMRDVRARGGFAYLARRGAEEAGAIFIMRAAGSGAGAKQAALYGPAPQVFYDAEQSGLPPRGDRLFMRLANGGEAEISARLRRELEFDPDIWIIEVENFPDMGAAANLRLVEASEAAKF